jgi:hypothetical protein
VRGSRQQSAYQAMNPESPMLFESLRKCLEGFEETTGRPHFLTLEMPRDEAWDKVRDEVSCLDSIGDVMARALDAFEGK